VSLRPLLGFNPDTPRRLSTPTDAFESHPDVRSYGTTLSLRDGRPTLIDATFDDATRGGADAGGTVTLRTDDMDLAGDIVQELCAVVGVTDLESTCDFPEDMERFRETLREVDERNADRARLAAEVADGANLVKSYIIRAEDARILRDMDTMMRMYNELMDVNRELIAEHNKRAENHQALLAALRRTNQMIQRAAKLRCGGAKTRIVSACRAAIKANNVHALFNLIQFGVVD
jgi:Bardet-Biedl syndrome 2 protein